MKIAFTSDTHRKHDLLEVPQCDLLIHCGDISGRGKNDEVLNFLAWFTKQSVKRLLFISGNHDFLFEREPALAASFLMDFGFNVAGSDRYYLQDALIDIDGVRIYGTPWSPFFHNWAFNLQRGQEIARKWEMIPENLDILITHGPPHGIGDLVLDGEEVGCVDLLERIKQIQPTYHCFGHVHEGAGIYKLGGIKTTFMNCSFLNEDYIPTNKPFVVDL